MTRVRGGFTLLEVVVALSILALIGTLTFGAVSGALTTRDLLEAEDEVNQASRIAMSRLRRDLSLAYLTPNMGAVNTYRTQFVGQNGDPDRIWLTTLSHQRLYRDARESDQTEITYWTEEDPNDRDALVLLRREAPRIDQEPEKDGTIQPVAYGVKSFQLAYLDSQTAEWREEWDTNGADTPNRLPRAVMVTLTMLAPDPDDPEEKIEQTFTQTVMLAFAPALARRATSEEGE